MHAGACQQDSDSDLKALQKSAKLAAVRSMFQAPYWHRFTASRRFQSTLPDRFILDRLGTTSRYFIHSASPSPLLRRINHERGYVQTLSTTHRQNNTLMRIPLKQRLDLFGIPIDDHARNASQLPRPADAFRRAAQSASEAHVIRVLIVE
jgi:hypothetical protein